MRKILCILSLCFLFTQTQMYSQAESDLVITEIMYNSPAADDIEFIEIINNGSTDIDMTGFSFTEGIEHTFPAFTLGAGEVLVMTDDSLAFRNFYTFSIDHVYSWTSGALGNGGEDITLIDANGVMMDSVDYDDSAPWSHMADSEGASLVLCDFSSDNNDASNWSRSTTNTNTIEDGQWVYASPGNTLSSCATKPIVQLYYREISFTEDVDTVFLEVSVENNISESPFDFTLEVAAGSTVTLGDDVIFPATQVITVPAMMDTIYSIPIPIIDDTEEEMQEELEIFLLGDFMDAQFLTTMQSILITDNDAPVGANLVLIGLVHVPEDGGTPKATEFMAVNDIPDLSIYGVGCANNGGGTDGIEYMFPSASVSAGQHFFLANDTARFREFFGFGADFEDSNRSANTFNGDDAYEVFESGVVIDVFGEIDTDGSGEPWEYTRSWAKRKTGTGPDGTTFVIDNWEFGGLEVLDGISTNDASSNPYPLTTVGLEVVDFSDLIEMYPNPVNDILTIETEIKLDAVVISNRFGQEVMRVNNPSHLDKINISQLANETYIVSFINGKQFWSTKLVVIK